MIILKLDIYLKFTLLVFIFSILNTKNVIGQEIPIFKNGDKVVFIGNSITQDGRYHMLLQAFYATRFPENKVEFYSAGVSGDVADGMLFRFEKDILVYKPSYAFLMTGMNDMQRNLYEPNIEVDSTLLAKRQIAYTNYQVKTEKLVQQLIQNGVKPILMTPSIYDQTSTIKQTINSGYNNALGKCAVHIHKMAVKYNVPVVDLYAAMNLIQAKGQQTNPNFTIIGNDRVHPGDVGHFVMTNEIIETILPSKIVSKIELNGKKRKVLTSENCTVTIEKDSKQLQFKVLEKALPFPIKKQYKQALQLVPFQQNLNNEIFIVQKLKKGDYELQIDGEAIASFSSRELKTGVNLANYSATPQYKQALELFSLCEKYHKTMGLLRGISLVEYRTLNKYKGPDTLESKKLFLEEVGEKQKGKSWYNYTLRTFKSYLENISKEPQIWSELSTIRTKIYSNNKPNTHTYKLVKL